MYQLRVCPRRRRRRSPAADHECRRQSISPAGRPARRDEAASRSARQARRSRRDRGAARDRESEDDAIRIGALTTPRRGRASTRRSAQRFRRSPTLAGHIGDRQVRNRGTLGGSLANNDPAACYPAAVLGLRRDGANRSARDRGGRFLPRHVRDSAGARRVDHCNVVSRSGRGGLRQVQAERVAVRVGRRVRGATSIAGCVSP